MTDKPHTPTTEEVRLNYAYLGGRVGEREFDRRTENFDRWLAEHDARIVAAAEQRGAIKAFRKTQEIIAGFDHTIDEARERGDMINTGHLIQEIDTEIQDLMEGDDGES